MEIPYESESESTYNTELKASEEEEKYGHQNWKLMELKFQTKEESNRQQEEAFLKLSEEERILRTIQLKAMWKTLPIKDAFRKQ